MAIKVIAQLREVKIGKNPGKKFVMRPDLYVPITEKKVFSEAATHSGISAGVIKAAWVDGVLGTDFLDKYGAVIDYVQQRLYLRIRKQD